MSRSIEETRRDFLVRLARTAAFVAPVVVSLDAAPAAAQGSGNSRAARNAASSVVGSLTPSSSVSTTGDPVLQTDETVPWDPTSGQSAPWTAPPPSSTG